MPTLLAASRRFSMYIQYIQIQAQSYFSVVFLKRSVYLSKIVNNEPEPPQLRIDTPLLSTPT